MRSSAQKGPPWWVPRPGSQWQWQLSGDLDMSADVPIYDIDGESSRKTVQELHALGRHVIAYLSVGTAERYRRDVGKLPDVVLGRALPEWPDERWLDIRRRDLLAPVLLARLDRCRRTGFDAVEPDNVDAWANTTGFPLTAADQLEFNRWIAREAHARGLGVALKNDLEQVPELVEDFDFAITEQCLEFDECDALAPFVEAGKAVLHVEYEMAPSRFRQLVPVPGFASILKRRSLDAWRFAPDGTAEGLH
ncbi:MAG: endo alpha-1,4 polygalactosaminidase [Actinomycetes bacterium]